MTTLGLDRLEAGRLVREAERYLRAVDAFRAEGHEPRWAPEWLTAADAVPVGPGLRGGWTLSSESHS
jgi:hypothetical protein